MTIVYTYGYDHETLPKKGLRTRRYGMDIEDHIVTLTKRGLKTRPYSMDMNKDIATLPKKGLTTRPYNIGMVKKGLKKYDYNIDMEKKDLKKLTKGQLIKLLMNQRKKPIPPPRTGKWESIPCKSVKQMVKEYENIILSPEQFRDGYKPTPPPRTGKWESVSHKSVNEDLILPPPDG